MTSAMYYEASGDSPLTDEELQIVAGNLEEFAIAGLADEFDNLAQDWRGDDYHFYVDESGDYRTEGEMLLQGSVKLASRDNDLLATVIYHLCDAVTDLRNKLGRLTWEFQFDDLEIPWDEDEQRYDLNAIE